MQFEQEYEEKKGAYRLKTRQKQHEENKITWRRSKLEPQHLEYLRSESTLRSWSGHSLEDRRRFFHRMFPDKKLSMYYLRLAY